MHAGWRTLCAGETSAHNTAAVALLQLYTIVRNQHASLQPSLKAVHFNMQHACQYPAHKRSYGILVYPSAGIHSVPASVLHASSSTTRSVPAAQAKLCMLSNVTRG
jgi:hypothetical protein